jgi:hypothetical protein
VKLLKEQKMTDLTTESLEEMIIKIRDLIDVSGTKINTPSTMIYWSKAQDPLLWANVAATTNTWEMEVNFYD